MTNRLFSIIAGLVLITSCQSIKSNIKNILPDEKTSVGFWLTNPDRSAVFTQQASLLIKDSSFNNNPNIDIDFNKKYQKIDGFGATLTGGSAFVINQKLTAIQRDSLLKELFSIENKGIGISYLRLSIGASDMSAKSFTYDDMPQGQTDTAMQYFSINEEKKDLIPVLKQILKLNPKIKILGSPWSPPTWMKSNNSFIGGKLLPQYYASYARYFVKYIQAMKQEGIEIDAITIQNEPENPKNEPSLLMTADEQKDFIKYHLGPIFKKEGINTKIILFDHNCDHPEYPLSILNDLEAKKYIDGSAFHMYSGEIEAMGKVHDAHPDRSVYFTEQWTSARGQFGGDVAWAVKNLVIGASRNWSKNVLQWNLANDDNFGPHTEGGCTECLGAVTIGNEIKRNPAYYIIAHASKFVRPNSVRIASNMVKSLPNVAFLTPEGQKVVIVLNDSASPQSFNIKMGGKMVTASLAAGAVGTYVW